MSDGPALNDTEACGNSFPCFRCGVCCERYQVLVSEPEAELIMRRLGITRQEWLDTHINPTWPGTDTFILRQNGGACIFLEHTENDTTRCAIERFKPESCREWVPGMERAECRQGLSRIWGLTVGSAGQLEGAQERIAGFRSFVALLVAPARP